MKKVLAIAPYSYLPYFSGGQKFIAKFFEWLSQKVELTVITVAENDLTLAKNYQAIPMLKKSFARYYDQSLVAKITALVEKEKFDTLIIEHPYFSWLANRIRKRTGLPFILHTHNIEYQRFRSLGRWWWPVLKWYEKRSFKKADRIYFITTEDKNFAITKWKIEKEKCIDLPFGIDINKYPDDKEECRAMICQKHGISEEEKIILFNGLLNYKSNLDALKIILNEINPILFRQIPAGYKIIICGKGLPDEFNALNDYAAKNIIYAGFVDAIEIYFKGADLFLNPVLSGGGIKTKMVEAIAYGTTVISTETGATGINKAATGPKLTTVSDNDQEEFADAIIHFTGQNLPTPSEFYTFYHWRNIILNIVQKLNFVHQEKLGNYVNEKSRND